MLLLIELQNHACPSSEASPSVRYGIICPQYTDSHPNINLGIIIKRVQEDGKTKAHVCYNTNANRQALGSST